MKNLATIITVAILASGCALSSDPRGSFTRTSVSSCELPNVVQRAIQSNEYGQTIIGIQKFEGIGQPYYQLDFADGTDRRYNPDGSETFRGIL